MRRSPSVAAAVLALCSGAPVGAAEPRWYQVRIAPCAQVSVPQVQRHVDLNLAAGAAGGAGAQRPGTRVEVRCAGSQLRVLVTWPDGHERDSEVPRTKLGPVAQSAKLAMAITEMLRAPLAAPAPAAQRAAEVAAHRRRRTRPGGRPPPRTSQSPRPRLSQSPNPRQPSLSRRPRPGTAAPPRIASAPPALRLAALATAQVFPNEPAALFGAGVLFGGDHRWHLGWSVDLGGQAGQLRAGPGLVRIAGLDLGARLLLHQSWSRLRLRAGAGARVGVLHLSGEPDDLTQAAGGAFWAVHAGPVGSVHASVVLRRLTLEASAEAGYVAAPIEGRSADQAVVSLSGATVHIGIGIGYLGGGR